MKSDMRQIIRQGLEERLPALRTARDFALKPTRGWLRAIRDAVGLRQEQVAQKLAVKQQSYAEIETAEERGSITMNSLQRAAEAMDCELVYFLIPREKIARTYTDLARLHDPMIRHLEASEHSMALEDQAVGDLQPKQKRPE